MLPQFYTIAEVAGLLGRCWHTIWREIGRGKLHARKVGRQWLILPSELAVYVGGTDKLTELLRRKEEQDG